MDRHHASRGQAFTLEGLVAGMMLLGAVLFAMQAVVVTPGVPGADVNPEIRQQANDVLDTSAEEGDLSELVRRYNASTQTFDEAPDTTVGYGSKAPPGRFGELLESTFVDRGMVVNVILEYPRSDGVGTDEWRVIFRGEPPDAATVATTTITLYGDDPLTSDDDMTVAEAVSEAGYPIPDAMPDSPVHNVVTVRVIVW